MIPPVADKDIREDYFGVSTESRASLDELNVRKIFDRDKPTRDSQSRMLQRRTVSIDTIDKFHKAR